MPKESESRWVFVWMEPREVAEYLGGSPLEALGVTRREVSIGITNKATPSPKKDVPPELREITVWVHGLGEIRYRLRSISTTRTEVLVKNLRVIRGVYELDPESVPVRAALLILASEILNLKSRAELELGDSQG